MIPRVTLALLGLADTISHRMPWPLTVTQYRLCCVYERLRERVSDSS